MFDLEEQKQLEKENETLNQLKKQTKELELKFQTNKSRKRVRELEDSISSLKQSIDTSQRQIEKFEQILEGHKKTISELESAKNVQEKIASKLKEQRTIKENIQKLQEKSYILDSKSKLQSLKLAEQKQIFREVCAQAKIPPILEEEPQANQTEKAIKKKQRVNLDQKTRADKIAKEKVGYKENEEYVYKSKYKKQIVEYVPKFKQSRIQETLDQVNEENKKPLEVTKENYIEYKTKIKELKKQYEESQRIHQNEIKNYNIKIKELSLQQKDLINREKEKDAEAKICLSRFNEYKRLTNHKSHQDYSLQVQPFKEINQALQKKFWQKALVECRFRPTKRELIGELPDTYPMIFDDIEQIKINSEYNLKVNEIIIFHDEAQTNIFGFQIIYFDGVTNELKKGQKNIHYKLIESTKQTSLKIEDTDCLRFVSGFFKDKINYLKFETQNGNQITIGSINHREKYKEFHQELKQNDVPILFFGVLDYLKNTSSVDNYVLVCFGMEIYNAFHNYNIRQNYLKNQNQISKLIDQSQLIEENISVENNTSLLHGRRGLFQNRIKPLLNQKN